MQDYEMNLQNLPVEADRLSSEEFLECDEFRRLGLWSYRSVQSGRCSEPTYLLEV